MNKRLSAGIWIAYGLAVGLVSCLLLLWIYAWCMVNPRRPDYLAAKLRMMLRMPDPGVATIFGLAGLACACMFMAWAVMELLARNMPSQEARNPADLPRD